MVAESNISARQRAPKTEESGAALAISILAAIFAALSVWATSSQTSFEIDKNSFDVLERFESDGMRYGSTWPCAHFLNELSQADLDAFLDKRESDIADLTLRNNYKECTDSTKSEFEKEKDNASSKIDNINSEIRRRIVYKLNSFDKVFQNVLSSTATEQIVCASVINSFYPVYSNLLLRVTKTPARQFAKVKRELYASTRFIDGGRCRSFIIN